MILVEYLRLFLLEGRRDDLAKKYSGIKNLNFSDVWLSDPSDTKKYVEWMLKQIKNNSNQHNGVLEAPDNDEFYFRLYDAVAYFDANVKKNVFKNKDINSYRTIDDLVNAVTLAKNKGPSKTQLRKESSSGAVKISEDDAWVVFRIDTKQAAQKLGRDAKWCITMPDKNYYEQYVSDGVKFYYFISKISEARTPNSKIAVAVYENSFEIFDAEDQPINRYGFSKIVGQNLIDDVKEDAPKAPAHIIYQVRKTIDNNGVLQPTVLQKYFDSGATDFEKAVAIQYAPNLKDKLALAAGNKFLTNIIEFYDYNKISDGPFFTLLDTDLDKELPSIIGLDYEEWRHNNVRHRDGDLPALTNQWGDKRWYKNGELHRDGGPAVVRGNIEEWYQNGLLHRDGGPAVEIKNGTKYWYQHGKLHRDDGPAVITLFPKTESWYQNGLLHRDGGPAMTTETEKAWYQHGKLHRDDGPAVEYSDGKKVYYKHGEIVAPPGDQQ